MKRTNPFVWPLLLLSSGCMDAVPESEFEAPPTIRSSAPATAPLALNPEVPLRGDPRSAVVASDSELWQRIEEAGQTVTIGFKAPGARRGVWRGAKLLLPEEVQQARQAVLAQPGVTLRSEDDLMPRIEVKLADREAMERLRRLPFVDYVEPARFQVMTFDWGCDDNSSGGTLYTGPIAYDPWTYDVVPWNYDRIEIQRAWSRGAAGQGVTVGLVDTGLFAAQSQLWNPGFSAQGPWRDHLYFANYPSDYYDTCNHGTRMAGVIAAPRDGTNIAGVAYRSNFRVSRAVADVYTGGGAPVDPIINGIRSVVFADSRIITMAWGQEFWSEAIADEIQWHYYNRDVLFIGAAGTMLCPPWGIFPARMDEVVSVTGLRDDNTVHPDACGYDTVDIGAVVGAAPTTGRNPWDLVNFGGSSNATALLSGTAALVWSKYPYLNRDQVRERLYQSTGRSYRNDEAGTGWGRVNAYRAVGGFYALSIGASNWQPHQGESVTFTALPKGDGPFAYHWSTGSTGSQTALTCAYSGEVLNVSVTVWDLTDGTMRTSSSSVSCYVEPTDPCEIRPWLCYDPCEAKPWLCED